MKRNLKLYIDTSVWNMALEKDREHADITNEFLNLSIKENHSLIISNLVMAEIARAHDFRRKELSGLIEKYKPLLVYSDDSTVNLANLYLFEKLIPYRFRDDAVHIAIATINHCDFLVSWNFKHIVKASTIRGVHGINFKEGFGMLEIVSPSQIVGKMI